MKTVHGSYLFNKYINLAMMRLPVGYISYFVFLRFKTCICSFVLLSSGVKSDQQTTKTEDMRQCALCQQNGDYAPKVNFTVLT